MAKKKLPEPSATNRLTFFLLFCNELEDHPFFKVLRTPGSLKLNVNFAAQGDGSAELNFDEYHFESFLLRLRQFFFPNELFSYEKLRDAIVEVFGGDEELGNFFDGIVGFTERPRPKDKLLQVFKSDGSDLIAGYNFRELMEARLYTGAIHSERRVNAPKGSSSYALGNPHIAISKYLTHWLASASQPAVCNVMATRNQILRRARIERKVGSIPDLDQYDARSKAEGH